MTDGYSGELFRKIAALERRIAKLEQTQDEFDRVIDPEGWIGEAFEKLEEHFDAELAEVKQEIKAANGKLDAILTRLTRWNEEEGHD
ncbi:MAG: hypothetical protein ACFB4I_17575 [Cyanophyceae cyanobacterium]